MGSITFFTLAREPYLAFIHNLALDGRIYSFPIKSVKHKKDMRTL
jgi:hypothetical protein